MANLTERDNHGSNFIHSLALPTMHADQSFRQRIQAACKIEFLRTELP